MIKLNIFIRTFNEAKLIARCLEMIFSQEHQYLVKVSVLDCNSTDNTVEIASKFPVEIFSIEKNLFTYSKALNFGALNTDADFLICLSAHAVPIDQNWLKNLVQPLLDDPDIVASFSKQVAWPEATELEKIAIENQFPDTSLKLSSENFKSNLDKASWYNSWYNSLFFSNVSSCICSDFLKQNLFREMPFSEDRAFALDAFSQNKSIYYAADSKVYHLHYPSFSDHKKIALNATLARAQLAALVNSKFGTKIRTTHNYFFLFCFKLPLVVVWALFKAIIAFYTQDQSRRYFDYYIAQIGTTAGKLEALKDLNIKAAAVPQVAQPDQIQSKFIKIKS